MRNKSPRQIQFFRADELRGRNSEGRTTISRERKPRVRAVAVKTVMGASGRNDRRFAIAATAGSREYRNRSGRRRGIWIRIRRDNSTPAFEEKTDKIDRRYSRAYAVLELLKSGRDIDKLFVLKPSEDEKPTGSVVKIVAMAVERHIPVVEVDRRKLDELAGDTPHQGVAAVAPEKDYAELDDIFELAARRGEKPLIVIADEINDPHNLGAIIRSAEAAGAHGIIIPKRRSAPITPTVAKASAGAVSWLPIVKVTNLSMLIEELRDRGVWVFCTETGGADYRSLDYDTPAALIVGSEGEGVSRLLREKSDFIVSIPMKGQVNSLNVSCAAAVMLFKMTESRSPVQPEFPEDDEDELFDGEFDFDDEFGDDETDMFSSENSGNEFEARRRTRPIFRNSPQTATRLRRFEISLHSMASISISIYNVGPQQSPLPQNSFHDRGRKDGTMDRKEIDNDIKTTEDVSLIPNRKTCWETKNADISSSDLLNRLKANLQAGDIGAKISDFG